MLASKIVYLLLTVCELERTRGYRQAVEQGGSSVQVPGRWYQVRESKRVCEPPEPIRHKRPLAELVRLSLSTDKQSYYVGEPFRLTMILRNEGSDPARGSFTLEPICGFARIYYRRVPEPFRELLGLDRRLGGGVGRAARTLKPGNEVSVHSTFTIDPVTGRFVLDEPGQYELKVVYRDVADDPNGLLTSDILALRVETPAGHEEEALEAYSRGELAPLTQYHQSESPEIPKAIRNSACEFLERYPDSVYADGVRRGLFRALQTRMFNGGLTAEESKLFEQLRAEGIQDR